MGRSWAILTGLGPSWGDLEPAGEAENINFPYLFSLFLNIMIWHKNDHLGRSWGLLGASWGDLGASWAELGPIWAAKRAQKGGQKGPKRRQKRDQNDIKILIDFLIDFGPILEAQGDPPPRPGGMRGAWLDSLSSKNPPPAPQGRS